MRAYAVRPHHHRPMEPADGRRAVYSLRTYSCQVPQQVYGKSNVVFKFLRPGVATFVPIEPNRKSTRKERKPKKNNQHKKQIRGVHGKNENCRQRCAKVATLFRQALSGHAPWLTTTASSPTPAKEDCVSWRSYASRQSDARQVRRQSLQCSWTAILELSEDATQTAEFVIKSF